MAKPDSNFVYYVTKRGGRNNLCKCVSEICAMLHMKESSTYTKPHTHVQEECSIVNEYNVLLYN
jgi:hypothetical protein